MKLLSDQLEGSLQSDSSVGSALTPPPTTVPFSERTLAAIDSQESTHRLRPQPETENRQIPLWRGIALLAAIAGSTFWGLRLLLDPGRGLERPPAAPLPSPTKGREATPATPLQDSTGELMLEDNPDPVRDTSQDHPQPEPTPTPPVAAPVPPPTPVSRTPLPPQPLNRPLFPPINRAAPPTASPTPSFLERLREERERLGKD